MSSPASLRTLLSGAIDYAGLFPPAKLSMQDAARNYASYQTDPHAWALGRFIVPILRLEELEACVAEEVSETTSIPWKLSVLTGPDLERHASAVASFNERQMDRGNALVIEVIETKAVTPEEARSTMTLTPPGYTVYFEVPLSGDLRTWMETLRDIGAGAKVRTGGIREDMFPAAERVARFIRECVETRIPFKATAGLHHPIRSVYNLTYEKNSPKGTMYGFLNVLVATAFAYKGSSEEEITRILEETSPASFHFDGDGVTWGGKRIDVSALSGAREHCIMSFGSCSFEEPIADLRSLNLL